MAKQHVRVELYRDVDDLGVIQTRWAVERDPDDATASAAYARDAIALSHGRAPEQGEPTPSSATLTFKGHTHNPENPASALYGLIGLNTPLRISTGEHEPLETGFEYTAATGWAGTGALSWALSGGTVPDDYSVSGALGAAVITHSDTNVLRYGTVDTGDTDGRVRVTFDLSASDLTGAGASVWILGRFADVSNYYAAMVVYDTSEVATLRLYKRVGGVLTAISDPVSIAETGVGGGGFDMIGELYIEGNRLYASAWRRLVGSEPLTWMVSAEDNDLTAGTSSGVTCRRETGNTNANLAMRFFDFAAIPGTIRFCGEVSDYRPRRAPGGDRWVEVEAGGPLLRLQSPQADALRSALWRENLFGNPLAFWPLNDGASTVQASSALPAGRTASISNDPWAPRQVNEWLEPLMTPDAGNQFVTVRGVIDQPASAVAWAGDFVWAMDLNAVETDLVCVWSDNGKGTASSPRVEWWVTLSAFEGDGFVTWDLFVQVVSGSAVDDTTFTPLADGTFNGQDGRIHHVRLTTVNMFVGGTDWELFFDGVSIDSGNTAAAWNPLYDVFFDFGAVEGQMSAGMLVAWNTATPPFNAANAAVVGRQFEKAGDRLARLFDEEGIAFELVGDAATSEEMGPQLIDTLAANAAACEAVDMGLLHDTRHQVGASYRTRESLYGIDQTPVTLDVDAGGEVAPPLEPVIGTLGVVNDVTVKRPNGSSARSVAESGPLNVNPPHLDREGIGRYPVDPPVNPASDAQLQGLADWRRHRGTVKAVRYPQVTVNYGALAADSKTALAASVSRLRIGDRVDLDNAEPTGVMQLVPGYAETLGPVVAEREITFNGTPANVYEVGVYDIGDKYDSAYSTTAAQITTGTDTSLSVAIEAGRSLWVTGSGSPQFPIDINLAGAQVRVTAISGASSPQTFTISTTVVNGIDKVIPAGTPVRLWAPRRYGL